MPTEDTRPVAPVVVHVAPLATSARAVWAAGGVAREERERAVRLSAPLQAARFLAGRRLLRTLLAARLACSLEEVPLRVGSTGKLELADTSLRVSLSRSGPWCAVAISTGPHVGVDIEVIRADLDVDDVVRQFFPIHAQLEYEAASTAERPAVFFRWWVRIEAAAKAIGRGLDAAPACLLDAPQADCHGLPGVALAVAAVTESPFAVSWQLRSSTASHDDDAYSISK